FRIWRSKFDFVNKAMGGYVSSNVYVIYGKSGRGKSAVSLEEVTTTAAPARAPMRSSSRPWGDDGVTR
ncbi:hypothetical protein, partial [Sphingomonas adhaesiva]|uniref:hypothetical protein n=1 Tax=Sphingomonas adhaesiva TaxID=28212 RepID=UPI0035C6F900